MRQLIRLVSGAFAAVLAAGTAVPSKAQCDLSGSPRTTLRTPLIEGAPETPALIEAPAGQPPPLGDGAVPLPVAPGHAGPPTLYPFHNTYPANHINCPSYTAPFDPAAQWSPGTYGPSTWVPPAPSTPGCDPGMLRAPLDFHHPPARVVNICPGGGIVGSAPTRRWGGQTTRDFGRYKHQGTRDFDFGQQLLGQVSYDGRWPVLPGASADWDLYGNRHPFTNGMPSLQTIAPH